MMHLNERLQLTRGGAVVAMLAAYAGVGGWSGPVTAQSAPNPGTSAPGAEPTWKSSPYHGVIGGDGKIIPCRCLYRGRTYQLGEKVCMQTYLGTVMTECDLQQNNTSWVPTVEACSIS